MEYQPSKTAADYIAWNLKASDVAELDAYGTGMKAVDLFPEWAKLPGTSIFAAHGEPVAMAGVHDGRIWMFSTDAILRRRSDWQRLAKQKVREWADAHGPLYNFVWTENRSTIDWLATLGASFSEEIYYFSPGGGGFLQFTVK